MLKFKTETEFRLITESKLSSAPTSLEDVSRAIGCPLGALQGFLATRPWELKRGDPVALRVDGTVTRARGDDTQGCAVPPETRPLVAGEWLREVPESFVVGCTEVAFGSLLRDDLQLRGYIRRALCHHVKLCEEATRCFSSNPTK